MSVAITPSSPCRRRSSLSRTTRALSSSRSACSRSSPQPVMLPNLRVLTGGAVYGSPVRRRQMAPGQTRSRAGDRTAIAALGLKTNYDLRTAEER